MKRWIFAASMFVCSVLFSWGASACPMCKDSIPNGETAAQAGSLPGGFNTSVYVLLLGLFATIGLMTLGIVKGVRTTNLHIAPGKFTSGKFTSGQNSRGFEVRPSDSSPDEIE